MMLMVIFEQISQFLTNLKLGITRLPEKQSWKLKQGKSSEFNPPDDEQVKSSPNLKVWSHEDSILYPNLAK